MIANPAPALVHLLRIASKTGNTLSGMFMVITSHVWKSGVDSPIAEIKKNDVAATILTAAAKVGIYPFVFPRLSMHLFAVWRDVKEFGWFGQSKSAICCMCYNCLLFQQNGSSEYKLRLLDYCWWTAALFFFGFRRGRKEIMLWPSMRRIWSWVKVYFDLAGLFLSTSFRW